MTLFRDRQHAGTALAEALADLGLEAADRHLLVLALPRGGVPVAAEVAEALGVPLDVIVVRKLGAPGHEELALGAVAAIVRTAPGAETGADAGTGTGDRDGNDAEGGDARGAGLTTVLNDDLIAHLNVDAAAIARVKASEADELRRRERLYRGERGPLEVAGRDVIVVDDGVATGATILAAAKAVRQAGAASVTLAVPVAPVETVAKLETVADEVVCLHALRDLRSVGQWFDDFSQTTDAEVTETLARARALKPSPPR